jgi:hypothetical protein
MRSSDDPNEPFETLTHARLLIHQGDLGGARRVLLRLVERRPGDQVARLLLEGLERRAPRRAPHDRAARRRIERLEAWLLRIRRSA